MRTRWSISNLLISVSHGEFVSMTTQFQTAAEVAFGTTCALDIKLMSASRRYTTFANDRIQGNLDDINKGNTWLTTSSLAEITRGLWKRARYVQAIVRPVDESAAPRFAFGCAEFKGERPRQATFYIQPDGESARAAMIRKYPRKLIGDGYTSNGIESRVFPSLGGLRF
jgi:hypothetical protein